MLKKWKHSWKKLIFYQEIYDVTEMRSNVIGKSANNFSLCLILPFSRFSISIPLDILFGCHGVSIFPKNFSAFPSCTTCFNNISHYWYFCGYVLIFIHNFFFSISSCSLVKAIIGTYSVIFVCFLSPIRFLSSLWRCCHFYKKKHWKIYNCCHAFSYSHYYL